MKKVFRRILSMALVFVLIGASTLNVFAASTCDDVNEEPSTITLGEYTIIGYENDVGESVLCEYKDGVLIQRNTISEQGNGVILREYFDIEGKAVISSDQLNATEVGVVSHSAGVVPFAASGYTSYGSIEYKVVGTGGVEYYTQIVNLKTTGPIETTYTIRSWVGKVVDLVSILVSAGIGTASIMSNFVPGMLAAAGVTIVGNAITEAFSTTVSCRKTTYTWEIYDSIFENESYLNGYKYYITDQEKNYGETYYNDVTPKDWGTTSMSVIFFNASYVYSNWTVNRWIK